MDALKARAEKEKSSRQDKASGDAPLALDDTERVKVLSPGRLVTKRFFRNKLAMVGLSILIIMFAFSFIGAIIYPYSQTQLFYKFDYLNVNYASATERTENVAYAVPGGPKLASAIANRFNSYIHELEASGVMQKTVTGTDGEDYIVTKLGDRVYTLSATQIIPIGVYKQGSEVAVYDGLANSFEWADESMTAELKEIVVAEISKRSKEFEHQGLHYSITSARRKYTIMCMDPVYNGSINSDIFMSSIVDNLGGDFEYEGKTYRVTGTGSGSFDVAEIGDVNTSLIASTYVFNAVDVTMDITDEFRINALLAMHDDGTFIDGGAIYMINSSEDGDLFITDASGAEVAALSTFSIRRYSGQDTLSLDFKETVESIIAGMAADNATTAEFVKGVHAINDSGEFLYNDDGTPLFEDVEITITRKHTGEYVLTCEQITYLIDIFSPPNREHWVGTDGDGMDVLARMMYGGRISLMVGFVVVILEIFLGVIMGGISGFFSGWVDTLIMRIADVFYCIPGYPILIIEGALFDKLKMDPYIRLIWMMITLGILSWASIARLVRGQILSLREQEFMIAQEATGMKSRRRIFRHLVPNVMPQLIVSATMGIGEVILYESTLSFLGLGVKHPLATWGTMINSVTSSAEAMIKYTYIWIPVGLFICLTVIAFNFTGDGLRDAFDPKMKR